MPAPRMTRDFAVAADPWPIVDAWAARHGFRPAGAGQLRTYRKGAGLMVGARVVQVGARAGWMHLEAWVAANGLARLMSLFLLPREITIEPGGMKAVLPRKMGQREVDDLLVALGQPRVGAPTRAFPATAAYAPTTSPTAAWAPAAAIGAATAPAPPSPLTGAGPLPPPPPAMRGPATPTTAPVPRSRRGRPMMWRVIPAILLLLVAGGLTMAKLVSSPSLQELNASASRGVAYVGPMELFDALVYGGIAADAYTKGDTTPGSLDTVISRSGNCTVEGQGLSITVFTRGSLMADMRDAWVRTYLEQMRSYGGSPRILVGPNWAVSATDEDLLTRVQGTIGGTLRE